MIKQYIVARRDLEMSPGKLAAQVAHAAVAGYRGALNNPCLLDWIASGETTVVLGAKDLNELNNLAEKLQDGLGKEERGVSYSINYIVDEGRTEIDENSVTCFSVGPIDEELVNKVLKRVRLY